MGAVGGNEFNSLPPDKRPEAGLLQLRAALGGFANLRPTFAFNETAVNSPLRPEIIDGTDILFVRELLGGLYYGQPRGWDREEGVAYNTMHYTRDEVARVARVAFQLAQKRRKKLTSVDKANVLEVSQTVARHGHRSRRRVSRRDAGASVCRCHVHAPDESPP